MDNETGQNTPTNELQARVAELSGQLAEQERRQKSMERKIRQLEHDRQSLSAMYENAVSLRAFEESEQDRRRTYSRLLLETCPSVLMAFDNDMRYVLGAGAAVAASFGYSDPMELNHLPAHEIFANVAQAQWAEETTRRCKRVLSERQPLFYNDEIALLDGERQYARITILPAIDRDGTLLGLVMLMYDITELIAIREEALAASQAKSNFLANMSHEIRTPMNAILGMSNLLNRTEMSEVQQGYVHNILAASDSLLNLINDILDFSKIDAQKFEIHEQPYSLMEMLGDVTNIISLRASEKRLDLVTNIDPELPARLIGDDLRIKQVLVNILSNAVKYTKRGVVTLDVQGRAVPEGIDLVCRVTDTGIGIKKDEIPLLFSAFKQLDMQKNRGIQGTGLGLAISLGIAGSMGGSIEVQSEYGQGSVFTVTIPQRAIEGERIVQVPSAGEKRVLVLGEGPSCQALERMLERLYILTEATRTPDAFLDALARHKYSHVFYWESMLDDRCRKALSLRTDASLVAIQPLSSLTPETDAREAHLLYEPLLISDVARMLNNCYQQPNDAAQARAQRLGQFKTRDTRALVVDDNEINLLVAAEMLKLYDMQIDTAMSGQEAIDACRQTQYDIIFMDHMMPGMDGVEATAHIRALDAHYAKAPIVALTANAIVGVRDQFLKNQMTDYLSKPIEVDELNRVLTQWLAPEKLVATQAPPPQVQEQGVLESPLLQSVQGTGLLDIHGALDRIGGLESMYESVLQTFFMNLQRKIHVLRDAWNRSDWDRYRIEVHGQKSALNTIGATRQAEMARKLELSALNGNERYIHENTTAFLSVLHELVETVAPLLDTPEEIGDRPEATQAQRAALKGRLEEVRTMLDALESGVATEMLQTLTQASYGGLDGKLHTILVSIESFDYDTAIDQIKTILAELD